MLFLRVCAVVCSLVGAWAPAWAAAPHMAPGEEMPSVVAIGLSDASGPIFTTSAGMTLYSTELDERKAGVLGCTNARFEIGATFPLPRKEFRKTCVDRWPPLLADEAAKPVGRWTLVARPNNLKQWAYDGRPIYTSIRDKAPGDVNGTMGMARHDGWRTVEVPQRFPPGLKLVRKLDGLLLADKSDLLIVTPKTKSVTPLTDWAPVTASELDVPFGDWGVMTRDDGLKQWTFRKIPLYRPRDSVSLQKNVAAGKWQPIVIHKAKERPKAITLQMTVPEIGWVYANAEGKTLYMLTCSEQAPDQLPCDEPGDPAAYRSALCGTGEQCAREWRPVLAKPEDKPVGYWGIGDVPDPPFADPTGAYGENVPMVRAWTFHGRPVYTFVGDKLPGEALGHCIRGTASEMGAITVLGDTFPVRP